MLTRQEAISRLRNSLKEVNADSEYSNRYLWNVFWTNTKILLKQESERNRLHDQDNIWQTICIKMDKVSPLLCTCLSLPMDCVVYRSRFKIPKMVSGSFGSIYRFISSLDLSQKLTLVTPYQYDLKQTKYNKEKYVFIHDGYLWTPHTSWSNLIISGIFEQEITDQFKCDCDSDSETTTSCGSLLYLESGVPDWLIKPAIQLSLEELGVSKQIPSDQLINVNENEKQISN